MRFCSWLKVISISLLGVLSLGYSKAQVRNSGFADTSAVGIELLGGKITVAGYLDGYFAYDLNQPRGNERSFMVSHHRDNEFTLNLAYADLQYHGQQWRARVVPAFGTYMNANYAGEYLNFLLEASFGIRLFKEKEIWIDAGILGSPYTNESPVALEQMMLTRSLAAEYVPYYLSGVKVGFPLGAKWNAYLYLLNGWQNIRETNKQKSLGTQIEFRPNGDWLWNWNTYLGYEENEIINPNYGGRYFSDIYFIYSPSGKLSFSGCGYFGVQEVRNEAALEWWNANLIAKYKLSEKWSISGRYEWFNDSQGAVSSLAPLGGNISPRLGGLNTQSASLCGNLSVGPTALVRLECRQFFGPSDTFVRGNGSGSSSNTLIVAGFNVRF